MEELINKIIKYNDVVVISNHIIKNQLIKAVGDNKKLLNITYKSFSDVIDDIIGSYSKNAKIDLANEMNITIELASIKLKNSLLVNQNNSNEKIRELLKIKEKYQSYLNKKPLALNIYKNKKVMVINDYQTNDLFNKAREILITETKIEDYKFSKSYPKTIIVHPVANMKEEIANLVYEIAKLLENKVDPKNIKINNLPLEYHPYLKEAFELHKIDLELSQNYSLYEYELTKTFLSKLKMYSQEKAYLAFEKIVEELSVSINKKQADLMAKITNVLVSYLRYDYLVEELFDDLIYTFKNTRLMPASFKNRIVLSSVIDEEINEDDHVFILAFNQDLFPKVFVDDDYLLDYEREQMSLITSKFKNKQERQRYLDMIHSCKNLFISYNIDLPNPKSSFIDYLKNFYLVKEESYQRDYYTSYSETFDKIRLGKKLDLYYKYEIKDDELYCLYGSYQKNRYGKFPHKFTGVDSGLLENFLKNSLVLSYTSIDKYFKCAFSFYIEKVLKIRRSTNEEALFIGNVFHELLNLLLLEDVIIDIDTFINQKVDDIIQKEGKVLNKKEKFFISKYTSVLKDLYTYLKTQNENSDFKVFGLEKEFIIQINKKYPVVLKGKIDKILTYSINGKTYAVVLDYKSGSTEFDLNRIIHGLNMQILFYFYFLNNFSNEKYHFAGGYLQGVLPNAVFPKDDKLSYQDQLLNHFMLNGYSTKDKTILSLFDHNYETDKKVIKGLRFTKEGDFYKGVRVISEEEFWKLLEIVEKKINFAIDNIINGNFEINPKRLSKVFDSCTFCPYIDLCYRDLNDYQDLQMSENFDFLKEDEK